MNSLQLSPKQLQEICHDFTNKPNGINTLLSIMLNSLMKAERKDFLVLELSNQVQYFFKVNFIRCFPA